jgi:hypothetical protein
LPDPGVTVIVYVPFCGVHPPPLPPLLLPLLDPLLLPLLDPLLLPLLEPLLLPLLEPLLLPLLEPVSATEPSFSPPELLPERPPLLPEFDDELHAVVVIDAAHEPTAISPTNTT